MWVLAGTKGHKSCGRHFETAPETLLAMWQALPYRPGNTSSRVAGTSKPPRKRFRSCGRHFQAAPETLLVVWQALPSRTGNTSSRVAGTSKPHRKHFKPCGRHFETAPETLLAVWQALPSRTGNAFGHVAGTSKSHRKHFRSCGRHFRIAPCPAAFFSARRPVTPKKGPCPHGGPETVAGPSTPRFCCRPSWWSLNGPGLGHFLRYLPD